MHERCVENWFGHPNQASLLMRRSVYIMLFILLCFSGTLMDVIIIRIVILFKVWETRSVWTDVLSTAFRDSSNSRKSENVSSDSFKNLLSWNFILSEAQMLNAHWLAASFQMQIWCATNWKDPVTMRKGNFSGGCLHQNWKRICASPF